MMRLPFTTGNFDSVLSNEDIGIGILLAVLLAAQASFLQSRRSQNDFVLGPPPPPPEQAAPTPLNSTTNTTTTTFEDWKEMSQPDNYILYRNKRRRNTSQQPASTTQKAGMEQRWVLLALLVLFTPIFTFEFFLTVGRQIVCTFSTDLCLPYYTGS